MRAVQLQDYGSADNIQIVDAPKPSPGPGQVLIKVAYGGLRWSDIGARKNKGAMPTPFIMGNEVSGTIEALGEGVTGFAVGDRVLSQPTNGGYAEYLAVETSKVLKVLDRVPLETALMYRVNGIASYLMVYEWAKVEDGETVLIHGAAGGVGRLVTQILKKRFKNVTVVGLTSTDEKCKAILANGADYAINYKAGDYVAQVEQAVGKKSEGGGVNVVFNGVGGEGLQKDQQLIRPRGRWVIYGAAAGAGPVNGYLTMMDSVAILPFSMMTWFGTPAMARNDAFWADYLAKEDLDSPVVHPLEDIAKVHAAMERGETQGKQVFKV